MNYKLLLLFTIFFGLSANTLAQYCEADLQGKVWKANSGFATSAYIDWYLTFSTGGVSFEIKEKNSQKSVAHFSYDIYLSNVSPDTFDINKVGKGHAGRFIVMRQERTFKGQILHNTYIAEILSLTDEELIIRYRKEDIVFSAI